MAQKRHILRILVAALSALLVTYFLCPRVAFGEERDKGAEAYVQDILDRLSANSERSSGELKAFYGRVVRHEINWTLVIDMAIAPEKPIAIQYLRLGGWLIDYAQGNERMQNYLQNHAFSSCHVTKSDADREGLSVWVECKVLRSGSDEPRIVTGRVQLKKFEQVYQITELEYNGLPLSQVLIGAMTEESAIKQHGVSLAKR